MMKNLIPTLLLILTFNLIAATSERNGKPEVIIPFDNEIYKALLAYSFNDFPGLTAMRAGVESYPHFNERILGLIKAKGFQPGVISKLPANAVRNHYICQYGNRLQFYVSSIDNFLIKNPELKSKHISMQEAVPEANANLSEVNEEIKKVLSKCEESNKFDPGYFLNSKSIYSSEVNLVAQQKSKEEESRNERRKAGAAIAETAKNNPDKMINCLVKWNDLKGAHEEKSMAKASNGAGFACLVNCIETLQKNGVKIPSGHEPEISECYSEGHLQAYPN
jgi:hypothetical protein